MLRHIRLKHPESYISPTEHPESYIAPPSAVKAVEENKITAIPVELQIFAKMLGKDCGSPSEGESECDGGNMETDISSNKADSRLELNSAVPCLDKVNTKVMCKLTVTPPEECGWKWDGNMETDMSRMAGRGNILSDTESVAGSSMPEPDDNECCGRECALRG